MAENQAIEFVHQRYERLVQNMIDTTQIDSFYDETINELFLQARVLLSALYVDLSYYNEKEYAQQLDRLYTLKRTKLP